MKRFLSLILLIAGFYLAAQESNPIATDRPTQSAGSLVVPKGNVLIEYGYLREKSSGLTSLTFANVLVRMGILKGVELRVTQNYLQQKFAVADNKVNGLSPTTIGTKVHLVEENGIVPQMSVIGQVTLTNGANSFSPNDPIPEVRFNFSNTLSKRVSLGYNLAMAFPEGGSQTFYTMVIGYAFAPGWTFFAEPYGSFFDGNADHRFDTGIIYLVKDNLQFDVSVGHRLTDIEPDTFIGFGAAIGF